jgi:hypothetical protein
MRQTKLTSQSNDLPWNEHWPVAGSCIWLCVYTHTRKNCKNYNISVLKVYCQPVYRVCFHVYHTRVTSKSEFSCKTGWKKFLEMYVLYNWIHKHNTLLQFKSQLTLYEMIFILVEKHSWIQQQHFLSNTFQQNIFAWKAPNIYIHKFHYTVSTVHFYCVTN